MSRFTCQIPIDPKGYHWVNEGDYGPEDVKDYKTSQRYEKSLMLYGKSEDDVRKEFRKQGSAGLPGETYDPFVAEPALFRIFAGLMPITPEKILRFAEQYGNIRTTLDVLDREEAGSFADWGLRIGRVIAALKIADEYIEPRHQRRRVNPLTLLEFLDENEMGGVELLAGATLKPTGVELQIIAYDLLNVIHLQLIDAICQRKHYRECDFCGKPFEVSPQINRSDRLFCTDNCRVKAYHRRKRQAIEMRAAGKSLRDIVKITQSDLETVQKWLKAGDERKKSPRR